MISALINNERQIASPNVIGTCPFCGSQVRSKCGEINIWHFAHVKLCQCDYWKEHESEWHIKWKSWFDIKNVEYSLTKGNDRHIADVYLGNYTILELQNSPLSPSDRRKREMFWGPGLSWIVKSNYERFKLMSFEYSPLPEDHLDYYTRRYRKSFELCLNENPTIDYDLTHEGFPVMWVWKHPKKWITLNPPRIYYVDLVDSEYILKVTATKKQNFGFGAIIKRESFVLDLQNKERVFDYMKMVNSEKGVST